MNAYFIGCKTLMLTAGFNWPVDDVKLQLVDGAQWAPTAATGEDSNQFVAAFLAAIPVGARIGPAVSLANKTVVGNDFKADNVTIPGVAGVTVEWAVFYKGGGAEASTPLLFAYDTATGLPLTPNGLDVVAEFPPEGIGWI